MDLEFISGYKEELTKEHGKIIVCMEKVNIHGLMVENIKVNTIWIKSKEKVNIHGMMENLMKDNGKMVNSMEKAKLR